MLVVAISFPGHSCCLFLATVLTPEALVFFSALASPYPVSQTQFGALIVPWLLLAIALPSLPAAGTEEVRLLHASAMLLAEEEPAFGPYSHRAHSLGLVWVP